MPGFPDEPFLRREVQVTDHAFGRSLAAGEVRQVLRGVYVRGDCPDTMETRVLAASRVLAIGHVFVDRSAAWLHGVEAFAYAELGGIAPLEVCVFRGRNPTERTATRGMSRDLVPADVMRLGPCAVTTPLRTALDVGSILRRRDAMAALDAFARLGGVDRASLVAALPRFAGRRGVVQLRELAPLADGAVESAGESWVKLAIHDAGLPAPRPQVWVSIGGTPTYRLDFAYERQRIAIEYDGERRHSEEADVLRDARRRQDLAALGWTVIVVRHADMYGPLLEGWLRRLREALAAPITSRRW